MVAELIGMFEATPEITEDVDNEVMFEAEEVVDKNEDVDAVALLPGLPDAITVAAVVVVRLSAIEGEVEGAAVCNNEDPPTGLRLTPLDRDDALSAG